MKNISSDLSSFVYLVVNRGEFLLIKHLRPYLNIRPIQMMERDWIPGLSCIENLHNAVHSSGKTVFVLSNGTRNDADEATVNGVIRQTFFMVQQRLLDEKVDVAVLILLDKMFPKLKYLQLRTRLCRKSVMSWPRNPQAQPLFWNQMRTALSSDNLKLYDNNISESFI
ncbi:toll-like receptor 7 isoform X3 [Gadus morhua]|uniref:toll-like receptor 7 isoform X3 n=1 Tax=Gadus morhua TaxID=8049 RepID=UPI0011B6C221|nr:toll-like receptor 7 isoform X3 [Gadus morhua]